MPIYEFVCESCGRTVERLQKLTDPPPEECPECGGRMAKIMSRNSFQLKGGGWYRDLYGSSSGAKPSAGDAKPAGGDAKPAGGDAKPPAKDTKTESAAPAPASTPATPAKKE